jgi:Gpi18-like mannosyltransferase
MSGVQEQARMPRAPAPLLLVAAAFLALQLQWILWPVMPPDMPIYLTPWYRHILDSGPVGAFATPFSNYTPLYLYFLALGSLADPWLAPFAVIKAVSLLGTIFLAYAMAALLKALDRPKLGGAIVFLVPTAVINGTLLAQCDAFWVGACLLAVAAILRSEVLKALVWCGIAIAFKAQAIFLAPFILGVLAVKHPHWWQWLVPPLVFVAAMLPAWLAGWPAGDLASIYLRQAGLHFGGNLANAWAWAPLLTGDPDRYGWIGIAAAGIAAIAVARLSAKAIGDRHALLACALLSTLAVPWLLPRMHERYFFLADLLAVALAMVLRTRRALAIAIAVQLASLSALAAYAFKWPALAMAGALVAAAAIVGTVSMARPKASAAD